MASRPSVTIIGANGKATKSHHPVPAVFLSPIRPDIVSRCTREWPRTSANPTPSARRPATRRRPSRGELVRFPSVKLRLDVVDVDVESGSRAD